MRFDSLRTSPEDCWFGKDAVEEEVPGTPPLTTVHFEVIESGDSQDMTSGGVDTRVRGLDNGEGTNEPKGVCDLSLYGIGDGDDEL